MFAIINELNNSIINISMKSSNSSIEYKNMLDIKEPKHNSLLPSSIDIWLLLTACIISLEDVGFPTIIEIKKILQDFSFSKLNNFCLLPTI